MSSEHRKLEGDENVTLGFLFQPKYSCKGIEHLNRGNDIIRFAFRKVIRL